MPARIPGSSAPPPAAPAQTDAPVDPHNPTTDPSEAPSAAQVLKESVKDNVRPPDEDEWDAQDALQEANWQEFDTATPLAKNDESKVGGKSKTVESRSYGKLASDEEPAAAEHGAEEAGKKKKISVPGAKEGSVVLAGADVIHQKVYGDQKHFVHGNGPAGTKTDAYVQGPSFSVSGYGQADAHMMNKGHFAPGVDLKVAVKVDANLVAAGASITKDIPITYRGQKFDVIVRLGANANVGANGELDLDVHLGTDGVNISADANGFVGAKGSLLGSAEVDMNGKELVGGEMQVSFAAGAGAGASFKADLHHFHASAYATVGVGVGVQLDGEVYASNIAAAIPHIISGH